MQSDWIQSGCRTLTLGELNDRAEKIAFGLASLGVKRGDTVAIYLRNDLAFFETTFAAGFIGAYAVPLNWHNTRQEAAYILGDCKPKALVVHADLLANVLGAIPESISVFVVPTPPEIRSAYALSDSQCEFPKQCVVWDEWVKTIEGRITANADSPGTIIYTSGTTGRPKGVRRYPPTPQQATASAQRLSRVFGFRGPNEHDSRITTVVTGPMYHSSPNTYTILAARLGATIILQPRFDAENLLQLIEINKVTSPCSASHV